MFIVAWVFFLGLMPVFFLYYPNQKEGSYQVHRGVLIISPDKAGHYQIEGFINDMPVNFMLDTGATFVAVSQTLAEQLQLEARYPITLRTASGEVQGELTRLKKLTFADFILYDVKAVIIPGSDNTVLLGMNVLSQFNLSQQDGQLWLKK